MARALVVGAGLSGLTAAWHLAEAGLEVEVADELPRAGGLIQTVSTPHGPIERAASSFVWTDVTRDWFARLEISPQFAAPESRRRYIFRDGRPRRWPLGPAATAGMLVRLAGARVTGGFRARSGESAHDWAMRVAGPSAAEWLIGPALQGIYAAPADELSAALIFRTAPRRRMVVAPPGGMGVFIERLMERLRARDVRFVFGSRVDRLEAGRPTVVATNAPAAARLLTPHAPALSRLVSAVRMSSLRAVAAVFPRRDDDLRGFGMLFPRRTGIGALGLVCLSDVFPGRTDARTEIWIYPAGNKLPGDLETQLLRDRAVVTGRNDVPLWVDAASDIERAIPVYGPPVAEIEARLDELPQWLTLAGNYLGRIGVSRLLEVSEEAARKLADRFPHT